MGTLRQGGQAMIIGLLFLGMIVVAMLLVYNHGILTRDRVQLENAADAAVYSQAKLFARNQNFIAYTNRAMVANEMSIGQMVAMMSWAKRYQNIPQWLNSFPPYQMVVAPPAPRPSFSEVLNAVYSPYIALGTGVNSVANVMVGFYPTTVSYFNMALSMFQKAFAVATVEAQMEGMLDVVEAHQNRSLADPGDELYIPMLGYFFLAQNTTLTYYGDKFSYENLRKAANSVAGGVGENVVSSFLGSGDGPATMLVDTSPGRYSDPNSAAATNGNARTAYKQFAAMINGGRNDWLSNRSFALTTPTITSPELPFFLGPLVISLQFSLQAGSYNDGGTAYRYNPERTNSNNDKIERYAWTSFDSTSLGFSLGIKLGVDLCIWIPFAGKQCFGIYHPDPFTLSLGMPIGAATTQLVAEQADAMRRAAQWGKTGMSQPGPDGMYGDVFDEVHRVTNLWGNVMQTYGTLPTDVSTNYAGPPAFFSLNPAFASRGTSHEFSIAVAKRLSDVPTTDSADGLNLNASAGNNLHRFQLETSSARDDGAEVLWREADALMTVSSAETYFASPRSTGEVASQYSPFWDARLREPSEITRRIANGELDPFQLLADLNLADGVMGVARWVVDITLNQLVDPAKAQILGKVPWPVKPLAERVVNGVVDTVGGAARDATLSEIGSYSP
ncbi:pilus assembly protein TadG-related protein [Stutzerimonas zhaodongensis]|uniref:pilus assembly protein TadG-related protein n=1 Tax=Stutzerimonas zhaodongensis TaxID=1176257 RepID=UPI0015EFA39D|nr:pilus assembly protein TadG-related protein [Stutzerimonas zhaodongensis]